jgi:hypothetical protein
VIRITLKFQNWTCCLTCLPGGYLPLHFDSPTHAVSILKMAGRGRGGRGRGRGGGGRGYAAAAGGDECACAMNMPLLEAMEELEAGHIRDGDTNKR